MKKLNSLFLIHNSDKGVVALSIVLMLSAIILTIAATVTFLSIGEAQSAFALSEGEENLTLVEGCADDVMLKIRSNVNYSASTLSRPEGICTVTYNSGGPTNWNITFSSQSTAYQRRIQVVFVRNSTGITLTSWKEI